MQMHSTCLFLCYLFVFKARLVSCFDPCQSLTTCGECIRVPNCAWCSRATNPGSPVEPIRCQQRSLMTDCPAGMLVDPVAQYKVIVDVPTLQLRPQKSTFVNLRLGQTYSLPVQFKVAKDYPLDLYYLMDVSNSMKDDKENLVRLAGALVDAMRNITSAFKLGFGSFVDKNVLPFVSQTGATCGSVEIGCGVTYSFQHQLALSENEKAFIVNSTQIIPSFDTPEGGFDALVQAMVCKDQIGWSDESRRMIVFVTDANAHIAGHGRLGGVLKPNDGQCHLDSRYMYTEGEKLDYPSLGQLSRLVKDQAINLIFAVTPDVKGNYVAFSKLIPGSSVGELGYDSQNIVQLIQNIYQGLSSSVEMKDTAGKGVTVRYYTSCTGSLVQENNRCDGLRPGTSVNFDVTIEVTECPINPADRKQTIRLYPLGINEALTLNIDVVCDCPCENPGNSGYVPDSPDCDYHGSLECGVCNCKPSYSGQHCQCSGDSNSVELESRCRADNSSSVLCSDRGSCVCGKCECQSRPNPAEIISGTYCECDNFSCDRIDGQVCSGNGDCNCGRCLCYSGWTGTACDCRTSQDTCIPIGGGNVCSGNGVCKCGACECSANAKGKYCEDCPTCPSRCDEFKPCVQCRVFQTGPYMANNGQPCAAKCTYPISVEDAVQAEEASERDCSYLNENNCVVKFVYGFDADGGKRVRVQREPICAKSPPRLAIGLGLLGGLILAGLLALLLYKISTYLYDKKQYAQFLDQQKNAKWSKEGNPLYVEPSTTFRNPVYNNRKNVAPEVQLAPTTSTDA